jgi:hypothetical protein
MYRDNIDILNKIIAGENNVVFLNIFENVIDILDKETITEIERMIISSKYAFIVDKLNIHQIYTIDEYNKKYKNIDNLLKHLNYAINTYLKYNITIKIIDKLFDIALND